MMNNYYNTNPYYSNNNLNNMYPQQNQQPTMQQQYLPLAIVNTKEDIERFIVQPNGAIFLYCEPLKMLCIKRADNIGRFTYEVFNLTKQDNTNTNTEYALKSEIQSINDKLNDIHKRLGVDNNVQQQ